MGPLTRLGSGPHPLIARSAISPASIPDSPRQPDLELVSSSTAITHRAKARGLTSLTSPCLGETSWPSFLPRDPAAWPHLILDTWRPGCPPSPPSLPPSRAFPCLPCRALTSFDELCRASLPSQFAEPVCRASLPSQFAEAGQFAEAVHCRIVPFIDQGGAAGRHQRPASGLGEPPAGARRPNA
jgi:hypothetical protein